MKFLNLPLSMRDGIVLCLVPRENTDAVIRIRIKINISLMESDPDEDERLDERE